MTRVAALGPCLVALAIAAASSSQAFASATSDQCVDANSKAQLLRRDGRLAAARDELLSCAEPRCPAMVRDDCTQRLDELNRAQPTVVFDAKDAGGDDLVAVTVTVDGRVLTQKLDGSPLNVDPGPHTFDFAAAGQPPVTRRFVLKEGEKARVERVVLGPATPPTRSRSPGDGASPTPPGATSTAAPLAATPPAVDAAKAEGWSAGKTIGFVAGAVGVGSLAGGALFGLLAQSAWNRSSSECNSASCPASTRPQAESDRQTAVSEGTVSTVGFVAGGVLVAGGVALFLASPSSGQPGQAGGLRVAPTLGPHAAGLHLQCDF